jgi:hypothetical protein
VEVDRRVLQPLMAQQNLNRAQVGAGFQQVCRKTMAARFGTLHHLSETIHSKVNCC